MKYIEIGKIVNTHGIKGELRIISDFKFKQKIFIHNFSIYIGNDFIKQTINSYRKHKQYDMITLIGFNDINDVLIFKGKKVYINQDDLILSSKEFLDEDLIGMFAYFENECIGKIKAINKNKLQLLFLVKNSQKEFFIPYVFDIIEKIDFNEQKIHFKNIKGLM